MVTIQRQNCLSLLFLCALTCLRLCGACGRGNIYIQNNEYRRIMIAINEDVPENPQLLSRIKEVFADGSRLLYQVTNKRAYMKDVTVLIPSTWSESDDYETSLNQTRDRSDVEIRRPDPREGNPNHPFTVRVQGCGQLGSHISLSDRFLLDTSHQDLYGPYEKVLVQEWAHLRYGIFDEYVDATTEQERRFYISSDRQIEATRCSLQLTGSYISRTTRKGCSNKDSSTGLFTDDCDFIDHNVLLPKAQYASIMYKQYLSQIGAFCDNDKSNPDTYHNREAPNLQNRKCQSRSAWEVMRSHADFENGANPPRYVADPVPTFRFVQERSEDGERPHRRIVLVLDTSGSMSGDRILMLLQGATRFLAELIGDGQFVGIVEFNSYAWVRADLTEITANTRQYLIDRLPTLADGSTSIGAGLVAALDMLEADGQDQCGEILLVSDGGENTDPFIEDVKNQRLPLPCLTVHSLAISSSAATSMDDLARDTRGLSFLFPSSQSNAIHEAFLEIAELSSDVASRGQTVYSQVALGVSRLAETVFIDSSLGNETVFSLDYIHPSDVNFTVTDPSGVNHGGSPECVEATVQRTITCKILGIAEPGEWEVEITSSRMQRLALSVTSKPSDPVLRSPIVALAFWGLEQLNGTDSTRPQALYAAVHQGNLAVLQANVTAIIDTPYGNQIHIRLLDNGAGADAKKDDGVYSAYFIEFDGDGRYNFKVVVSGTSSTIVNPHIIVGVGAAFPQTSSTNTSNIAVNSVSRVATAGSFQLTDSNLLPVFAPARIDDLLLREVDKLLHTVTLQWTAVGAQLDSGIASSYELRMAPTYEGVLNDSFYRIANQSDVIQGNLSAPEPAGATEVFVLQLQPQQGDVIFFGVIAHDEKEGTPGEMSNIVGATFSTITTQEETGDTGLDEFTMSIVGAVGFTLAIIAALIGLGCAGILLMRKRDRALKKRRIYSEKYNDDRQHDNPAFCEAHHHVMCSFLRPPRAGALSRHPSLLYHLRYPAHSQPATSLLTSNTLFQVGSGNIRPEQNGIGLDQPGFSWITTDMHPYVKP